MQTVLCRGKIPDSCAACRESWLIEQNNHFTRYCPMIQQDVSDHDDDRPDNCFFLKQLPDKHGDLIDRNTLQECVNSLLSQPASVAAVCLAASIDQATSIIDEEK